MISTLGQPPADTLLDATSGTVDVSDSASWTKWFTMIFNILINVGPQWTKVADVTFPICAANSSVDVLVPFPAGIAPATGSGDIAPVVTLGLSANTGGRTKNSFMAWVSALDVVTIRQVNAGVGAIAGFTDTFTITVLTGAPSIK